MDGIKKPHRGSTKIYVRNKDEQDQTLVELYKESEFTKENSVPKDSEEAKNNELLDAVEETDQDDEIEAFINDSEDRDYSDVPEKESAKKARKKAEKKEEKKKSALAFVGKLLVAIILIAGLTAGGLFVFKPEDETNVLGENKHDNAIADEIFYEPLTGRESKNKEVTTMHTTCIMIENSTDARPQSGLRDAGIVYEALAEGGITRFMAVYQEAKPNYVGPIRSARWTFVQFAKQYQCGYVHMGGATNAINKLNGGGYRDINAGYYENKYVSRKISPGRYAPHNVYTRFTWMDELSFSKGWNSSTFTAFSRIEPDTITEVTKKDATQIHIKMSGDPSYNPSFTYNPATNQYLRSHDRGGAHNDKAENGTLTQISPDVVIAMKVLVINREGDVNGYKDHQTFGEGDAFVFQDGTVTAGKWRRTSENEPLKFYNMNNEEILLNRGQTWITAYPSTNGSVNWN